MRLHFRRSHWGRLLRPAGFPVLGNHVFCMGGQGRGTCSMYTFWWGKVERLLVNLSVIVGLRVSTYDAVETSALFPECVWL